ncbi:TraB/GumN family protein [Alkalitalea saponilacus]|uniref:TraB family protein n=1 Tax=Alkalitalea saponilacus TaxID=889453 RepID=A0A1T5HF10_9BACT|nr:TraB/GumN family protein [Alkalitalea saponilacus]ASB48080.1 TraB/GumN family protein [Alkalitalea saponilacus]SKC19199.1 hypothetical protein SAMN03080601_02252 [Alkalitalea saponilacus]
MKRVFVLSLFFCTMVVCMAQNNSLLYRVSGNGLEQPSWIYGTIHMICADDFFVSESVTEALKNSQKMVMELDMSDPQMMQKMQSLAMHPEMKNISDAMTPEEIEAFNNYLTSRFGAGLEQIGMMKPFVIASMLVMTQINCDRIESYENYFLTYAIQNELTIKGLETIEFQTGIFDNIPYELQVKELVTMINDPEKGLAEFEQLVHCYKNQDINCLYEAIKESDSYIRDFEEILLTERNKNWVPILEKTMASHQSFIAVGAGHLPGEKGLLNLLKKAGYTVEAIK